MPDWMTPVSAETPVASEVPDWMSSLRTTEAPTESAPEDEGVPDWLKGFGAAAAGAAVVGAAQAEPEAEPVPEAKPVTDWLSSLRQATPEMEEQAAAEEETAEIPSGCVNLERRHKRSEGHKPTSKRFPNGRVKPVE